MGDLHLYVGAATATIGNVNYIHSQTILADSMEWARFHAYQWMEKKYPANSGYSLTIHLEQLPVSQVDEWHRAVDPGFFARNAALEAVRAAGDKVAHRLQMWVNDTPGGPWCYSEAALAEYRAATAALDGEGVE